MGEAYFNLKRKLEELGYNNILPIDAVPLVECVLADLLQTTRSLQHYMELSKEALMQRDSLMMEAEPYKCDNAKLIQENNQLHREVMLLKEENFRLNKESRRKLKALSDEIIRKDNIIFKLQHDVRDLSLRGLCADTQSSRNKSKKKDFDNNKICVCNDKKSVCNEKDITELMKKLQLLEEKNDSYSDEIVLLKNQVEHRDNEIIRLNILLEGGRSLSAINKDCCNRNTNDKVTSLMKELQELEVANEMLKKEVESGLEKQHEAMSRALSLADKNKTLQEELQKVDTLALKVEEDANKRLAAMMNNMNFLQTRLEGVTMKNAELEREVTQSNLKVNSPKLQKLQDSLNFALKENDTLHKEIKDLIDLNKSLQDKILSLSNVSKTYELRNDCEHVSERYKCPTKNELQKLLEDERRKYEKYIFDIQEKMTETMNVFNKHLLKSKEKETPRFQQSSYESVFVKDLQMKLCESEHKILMLKKEIDDYKVKISRLEESSKQNYKDVISQLNDENAELCKENITLSQQLSHYRNLNTTKYNDRDFTRRDVQKLQDTIDQLKAEVGLLKKDKQEYNLKYKEAKELADKLKRDLVMKQKEIEQLEEENKSYKMTYRNGKASAEHLREECGFLREQIKKMQTDVIKEKTLANQIKNIQLETERSSNEVQNELLSTQKKLSLFKDTNDSLESKCKELQSEIACLRNDKSNLIDNIKKIDQDRDKLVIELDHKTETISVLEQKIKYQAYDINKLENELTEFKRKLNVNKVSEHKLVDYEGQINFLNNEILRLTQQYDNAIMENKHLQNSLADANGTLKITKIEYDKSRKEVDGLKQQLQHYVVEIRRIEELLSQKEAERSDMLEQFASLSVEANILENTNHSLESESQSKSLQLQSYIMKIQDLEGKLLDKESINDNQSAKIASMTCRINALENEIKLITEEKTVLEQNITYLKQMCNSLQAEHSSAMKGIGDVDSELKLYENRIKSLSNTKTNLEVEKDKLMEQLATTESLLSNARREIVELKLALQDATTETKSLQNTVNRLSRADPVIHETTLIMDDLDLPLMLEEIHEVSQEDDDNGHSQRYHSSHKRLSKYSHSGTL